MVRRSYFTARRAGETPVSLALKRFQVYLRTGVVVLLVGAIGIVLLKNRNHEARFWFFGLSDENAPVNVVWLLVSTAGTTLLIARIVWFMRGLMRDMRELRHSGLVCEQQRRAAELDERERRLDEKLKAAGSTGATESTGEE